MKSTCPNPLTRLSHYTLLAAVTALSTAVLTTHAQITWQTPVNITGDSDVTNAGTFVYSYDYAALTEIVNGVTFLGASSANAGGNVGTTLTTFNTTAFTSAATPFAALSPAYQAMLIGSAYASSASSFTVTLSNLVTGHEYLVQFWVNDPRSGSTTTRQVTLSSTGGNSVVLAYNYGQTAGDPGQYAVGLFVASGSTQSFTLVGTTGSVPQMNALQVRDLSSYDFGNDWAGFVNGTWDYTTANWGTGVSFATLSNQIPIVNFGDSNALQAPVTANVIGIQSLGVSMGLVNFLNSAVNYTLNSATGTPGITGASAVNVLGSGTVTFAGPNTYTGGTTVKNGTLVVNGSLGSGAVTVSGGTLNGTGTINGATAIQSGGRLTVGTTAATGTLTLNSSLSLAGVTVMKISKTGGLAAADKVAGMTTLTYGGTLVVTNITSDGSLLAAGDTFTLFTSSAFAGSFTSLLLPAVSGLNWDVSKLAMNGSIALVNSAPPPFFSPLSGTYTPVTYPQGLNVTITSSGSTIYYTTNGTAPTAASANGSSPLTVTLPPGTFTINAYAAQTGFPDSGVASATYTVVGPATWKATAGGNWSAIANWLNNSLPNGNGQGADFGELTLPANLAVTLDASSTVGSLNFGDVGTTYSTSLQPGSGTKLTLNAGGNQPAITVRNQTATISAPLAGTNGLVKTGAGTLVVGLANTYTGTTVINQGFLQVSNVSGSLGTGSNQPVVLNGGGIAALFPSTIATVVTAWPITVGPNGGEIDLLQVGSNGRWQFAANSLSGSGTLTLKNEATRFAMVDQSGGTFTGKWILDGINPNGGQGYIGLGTVYGDACFGPAPATFTPDAITMRNNAPLLCNGANPASFGSPNRGFTIGAGGGMFFVSGARTCTILSQISGTSGDPVNFAANNNQAGLQLNVPCTYNGNTVIDNAGTTAYTIWLRMGTNNAIPYGPGKGLLTYTANPGVLDLNGFNATINGFGANFANSVVDDMTVAGTSTLTVGSADVSSAFAGIIRNTTGTVGLTKIGAGTVTLSGTANTYTGTTTVSNGTLVVSSAAQTGGGAYSVSDGATLVINATTPMSVSALTLGSTAGCTNQLSFSSNPTGTAPVQAASLTANAVTLVVNFAGGVGVGQYPLIQYNPGGLAGAGFGAFHLVTIPASMSANLVDNTANNSIDVNVSVAPTIGVTLDSSPNPSVPGQPVVYTANATISGSPASGTVTFKNGTATLGTAVLNGAGVATLTNSLTTNGTYSITAVYQGVTSLPISQAVNPGLLTWSGTQSGVWDINPTTNWLNLGVVGPYYEGDLVQLDDTALSNTVITLNVAVHPNTVIAANNAKNYSIGGNGIISGATSLIVEGRGTLTLSNTNNYSGNTVVSNGVLTFSGTGCSVGTSSLIGGLFVGDGSGTAVLNMNSTGQLWFDVYAALGGISGDSGDTGSGALYQSSGTINVNTVTGGASFVAYPLEIGAGGPGAYGYYSLSGGTLNCFPYISAAAESIRVGALGQGVFIQSGGTVNTPAYFDVGTYSGGSVLGGGNGVATFTGGSAVINTGIRLGVESGGTGVMNLGTQTGGAATVSTPVVQLGLNGAAGALNLNHGALQIATTISGPGALNLNGGTLQATAAGSTLIDSTVSSVTLFNGGVVLDTQNNSVVNAASILAATGNGIYPAGGILTITSGGGSQYIGAPLVTVSGGSGSGAMAVATITNGVITNLVMTCPGQGYVAGDSLSFDFAGGGTTNPASTFNYTLTAGDLTPNTSGVLTKTGSGTLEVDGSVGGPVNVSGGKLEGAGSISGAVTVQAGGTLGAGSTSTIGQFNLSSTLVSSGTISLRLDKTGGLLTSDLVSGMSSVTYGGALIVSNITSDTTLLALGDTVTLFTASAYAGSFSTFTLPPLPSGLAWDKSQLTVNGSLQVVAGPTVNTTPTNITASVTGSTLTLSWPADRTGWRLLVQTNHLATGVSSNTNDWTTVPGSATTNRVSIPILLSNPTEFYRLVYP